MEEDEPANFCFYQKTASLHMACPVQKMKETGIKPIRVGYVIGKVLCRLTAEHSEKLLHPAEAADELIVGKVETHLLVVATSLPEAVNSHT